MKSSILPDSALRRMSPEDRKSLGKAGRTFAEIDIANLCKKESDLQKQIANRLRYEGIPFEWKRTDKKSTGTIGWPDFTFPVKGFFYGIEVKFGAGALSKEQIETIATIEKFGGKVAVIRTYQEFNSFLREILK